MKKKLLFFVLAMTYHCFQMQAAPLCGGCNSFYTAIYSAYSYDVKLETKGGRDIIDSISWTDLALIGWRPSVCFQPFIGVGAYKLRVVDQVTISENTVSNAGDAQGNMTTKPGIAGTVGVDGLLFCLPCNNFLKYRLNYFVANPEMSYAVVRGSIGSNQDIHLLYQQFESHAAIGRYLGCGTFYLGADFLYTNANFSNRTVLLTENNTYTLSDYRNQNIVGAVAGVEINPCCSDWYVKLETTFVTIYAVNLEFGLTF